jgi:chromosome partitioning protein
MRKIAVSLSKGGVGKTTTTINLGHALARVGATVLLVDTDTQGSLSQALGLRPPQGLAELVAGQAGPETAIVEARERLWLLAGGRALAGLKREISRRDIGSERALAESLAAIEGRYDFVLLDSAPSWDVLSVNTLFYAQEILAPVSLEVMTLQGLLEFQKSLEQIQKYHPITLQYVLPTFYDRRVKKSKEILRQLWGVYKDKLCPPIRYNVRLSEAPGFAETIYEYDGASPGAEDYTTLSERILSNGR